MGIPLRFDVRDYPHRFKHLSLKGVSLGDSLIVVIARQCEIIGFPSRIYERSVGIRQRQIDVCTGVVVTQGSGLEGTLKGQLVNDLLRNPERNRSHLTMILRCG